MLIPIFFLLRQQTGRWLSRRSAPGPRQRLCFQQSDTNHVNHLYVSGSIKRKCAHPGIGIRNERLCSLVGIILLFIRLVKCVRENRMKIYSDLPRLILCNMTQENFQNPLDRRADRVYNAGVKRQGRLCRGIFPRRRRLSCFRVREGRPGFHRTIRKIPYIYTFMQKKATASFPGPGHTVRREVSLPFPIFHHS